MLDSVIRDWLEPSPLCPLRAMSGNMWALHPSIYIIFYNMLCFTMSRLKNSFIIQLGVETKFNTLQIAQSELTLVSLKSKHEQHMTRIRISGSLIQDTCSFTACGLLVMSLERERRPCVDIFFFL